MKKQYRDDLEELTISYEKRRKALKDALHAIPAAGGSVIDSEGHVVNHQKEGGGGAAGAAVGKGPKSSSSGHDANANRPLPAINKRQHQREDPVEYY